MSSEILATCIGSFPHRDARAICRTLIDLLPDCPAWPQLSNRSRLENMYAQFAAPLPGVRIDEAGDPTLDLPGDASELLTEFFQSVLSGDLERFAPDPEFAEGYHVFLDELSRAPRGAWVKGHVTGPISFGLTVTDRSGRAVLFDPTLRDVVVQGLAAQARAQCRQLARTGRRVILFVDEPYLSSYGSATVAINESDVVDSLTAVTDAILEEGALPGVHCCGNTDWSLLMRTTTRIINFDAFSYLEGMTLYPEELAGFLSRQGRLAWGVVPTDAGLLAGQSAGSLLARLREGMDRVVASGVDRGLLAGRLLVTPSCGTGTMTEADAERAVALAAQVADAYRQGLD